MKKILVTAFLTIASFIDLFAQQTGGIIKYIAQSGRTTVALTKNNNGYPFEYLTEEGFLYFEKNKSLYKQKQNKIVTRISTESGSAQKSNSIRENRDSIGTFYYRDFSKGKLIERESYWNKSQFVFIEEGIEPIKWVLFPEKKLIGKYNCQKAEADFKGRHWIAWFAGDITIDAGPWKLCGLPGLILEAYDSKNDFVYMAQQIMIPADVSAAFNRDWNFKAMTREEYRKTNALKKTKYVEYMESNAALLDSKIKISFYPEIEVY